MAFAKRHGAFVALFAVAALVRFAYLDGIPGPAGDEGNWTTWALDLSRGRDVAMPPEASFVSLGFARLIAFVFGVSGPSFAAARSVNAAASLAAVAAVYAAFIALGYRRGALAAAFVVAFHPWCIAWSRTAAVPYAIALATSSCGASAFVVGLENRRPWLIASGIVVVAFGAHVSPLSVVSALVCGVIALGSSERRAALAHPAIPLALAVAAAIAAGPVVGALHATAAVNPPVRELSIVARSFRYLHMVGTGLSGEATLRHFGGAALPPFAATVSALIPFAGLGIAAVRRTTVFGLLGVIWVVLGAFSVPIVLAFGRSWYLPNVDCDRYLFAFLPGLAFLAGDLCEGPPFERERGANAALLLVLVIASLRLSVDAMIGGGPDRGVDVFADGGSYRGFRSSASHRAPAELVADLIARELPRGSGVVLAEAAQRPVGFALARRFAPGKTGLPRYFVVEAEYFPDPYTHSGQLAFVVYARSVFDAEDDASEARSLELRERMIRDYENVRLIGVVDQPNGAPLLEVYRARRPDRPYATAEPPDLELGP